MISTPTKTHSLLKRASAIHQKGVFVGDGKKMPDSEIQRKESSKFEKKGKILVKEKNVKIWLRFNNSQQKNALNQ
jgi:hypothetical protein